MTHAAPMETRRLDHFIAIVECGSITQAARRIGIAQPALSQQLAVLEHEMRTKLLVRSRTGVLPTGAGLRLYERAKRLVPDIHLLRAEVAGEAPSGVNRVGLMPSSISVLGLPFLRAILRDQPGALPQIIEAPGYALRELLARRLVDVAVLPNSLISRDLAVREIYRDELRIIAASARQVDGNAPSELAAMPWVVTRAPNTARNALSAWFARHGLEPHIIAELDSQSLVLEAVRANLGVALMSSLCIPQYFDPAGFQRLPFPGWLEERTYFACWDATVTDVEPPSVGTLARIGAEVTKATPLHT